MKDIFTQYSIGHFINEPSNLTEFEITRFGEMEEPDVDDIHKHSFYEIIWIERGVSRQVIDYQSYEIKPGSLFFISPGQVHIFEEWKPLMGGTIMFTEDFLLLNNQDKNKLFELSFLDNFYSHPVLQPDKKNLSEIHETIELLIRERRRSDWSKNIAQALLQILLLRIQRCIDHQSQKILSKRSLVIFKEFKKLLDSKFHENVGAGAYASELAITQHHLNAIVRDVTGKTATEVIRARSILEAKRMLTFTDYSVSDIAARLGYFDSSYFSKVFRAEMKCSPQEFRASISESYRRR